MFILLYELKVQKECMFLKICSFTFVKVGQNRIFAFVGLNSADLCGNSQRLNFTKNHTPEDEHDGNGEILYKTLTK